MRGAYSDYMRATAMSNLRPHARVRALRRRRDRGRAARAAARRGLRDLAPAHDGAARARWPRSAGARRSSSRCATCGRRRRSRWARCATRSRGGSPARSSASCTRRSTRLIALSPGIQAALPPGQVRAGAERGRPRPVRPRAARARPASRCALLRRHGRGERPHRRRRGRAARPDVPFVLMGDGKRRAELERAAPPPTCASEAAARLTWPGSPPSRAPA